METFRHGVAWLARNGIRTAHSGNCGTRRRNNEWKWEPHARDGFIADPPRPRRCKSSSLCVYTYKIDDETNKGIASTRHCCINMASTDSATGYHFLSILKSWHSTCSRLLKNGEISCITWPLVAPKQIPLDWQDLGSRHFSPSIDDAQLLW